MTENTDKQESLPEAQEKWILRLPGSKIFVDEEFLYKVGNDGAVMGRFKLDRIENPRTKRAINGFSFVVLGFGIAFIRSGQLQT